MNIRIPTLLLALLILTGCDSKRQPDAARESAPQAEATATPATPDVEPHRPEPERPEPDAGMSPPIDTGPVVAPDPTKLTLRAQLFYNHTGTLGTDTVQNPVDHFFNVDAQGNISHQTLFIIGAPTDGPSSDVLVTITEGGEKVREETHAVRSTLEHRYHIPILFPQKGCEPVTLTAAFKGAPDSAVSHTLNFGCGE